MSTTGTPPPVPARILASFSQTTLNNAAALLTWAQTQNWTPQETHLACQCAIAELYSSATQPAPPVPSYTFPENSPVPTSTAPAGTP